MEEITELKNRLGVTWDELAGKLGISRQALWAIQSGKNNPSKPVKLLVARLHEHLDNVA